MHHGLEIDHASGSTAGGRGGSAARIGELSLILSRLVSLEKAMDHNLVRSIGLAESLVGAPAPAAGDEGSSAKRDIGGIVGDMHNVLDRLERMARYQSDANNRIALAI